MTSPLPAHIRTKTLKKGGQRFEARLKRGGIELSETFKTEVEALKFGVKVDAMLSTGMSAQDCKTFLKGKKAVNPAIAADIAAPNADQGLRELTVKQAMQHYISHRQKSHNAIPSNYLTDYERVRDDLGDFPIYRLRNEDISNYISTLMKTPIKADARRLGKGTLKGAPRLYAEATVRKFITALRVSLEWNAKNTKVELNKFLFDFDRKTMPAAWAGKRERRLEKGEEDRLYAAGLSRGEHTYTEEDWRNIIGFALETAMRQQEISKARWHHIAEDGLTIRIPSANSKTKDERIVLLSSRAREIIKSQEAHCPRDELRIFHQFTSTKAICDAFARLTTRAGIDDFHFHDLRHEGTSRLCISGKLPLMALMEMTGHKTMTTFRCYVHLIKDGTQFRLD